MTETIQTAMDRLMTISVEPQDYVAEDGLLYCGSCKTPKEAFFPNGIKLFGRDRHPAECRCRQATREKQEKEERARLHYEKVQRLKLQVLPTGRCSTGHLQTITGKIHRCSWHSGMWPTGRKYGKRMWDCCSGAVLVQARVLWRVALPMP